MKNKELLALNQILNEYEKVKGKDFAYMVFKNKELIESEMKIFDKLKKEPHPEYQAFENERMVLCTIHSEKDENGTPVTYQNRYKIKDMEAFNVEFVELREKYKSVIEDMEQSEREFNEFMENEATVELVKVNFKDVPNEIDADQLKKLKDIIIY